MLAQVLIYITYCRKSTGLEDDTFGERKLQGGRIRRGDGPILTESKPKLSETP
jgi:hypothetical protein